MLVCNVSLRPRRTVAVDIIEAGAALDECYFPRVLDLEIIEAVSASDIVTALLGQIVLEAASAGSTQDAALVVTASVLEVATADAVQDAAAGGVAAIVETATAFSTQDAAASAVVSIVETATAASTQDATAVSAAAVATIDGVHVKATTSSTLLGTEQIDSGLANVFEP